MSRTMTPTARLLCTPTDAEAERISTVEGVQESGELTVKVLQVGADILMLEVTRKKGQFDPPHKHDDHRSCGYLIEGLMRVTVGDQEMIAGPGLFLAASPRRRAFQ